MKILIIGSGGREHAIAWKLSQSHIISELYTAPGNAGTSKIGKNIDIDVSDFTVIKDFVLQHKIEMLIVGPEVPLVEGIHDFFLADQNLKHIPVIGPTAQGALLEGSKDFAKSFMLKYGIPTAGYQTFDYQNIDKATDFLKTLNPPYVLKADGLAAGKGVLIIDSFNEAVAELKEMITNEKFGSASQKVVIEEFLAGIECSVFVLTDGESYKILPSAKDYKRIGEGDTGLNTGGMGSISPVPFADKVFTAKPDKIEYSENNIKYKMYGSNVDNIIKEAIKFEEGPEKDALVHAIANHLKKSYLNWNRESVDDDLIFEHLEVLSGGKLKLNKDLNLNTTSDILARNKKKKPARPTNTKRTSHYKMKRRK